MEVLEKPLTETLEGKKIEAQTKARLKRMSRKERKEYYRRCEANYKKILKMKKELEKEEGITLSEAEAFLHQKE